MGNVILKFKKKIVTQHFGLPQPQNATRPQLNLSLLQECLRYLYLSSHIENNLFRNEKS